jgi:hypothetical protein
MKHKIEVNSIEEIVVSKTTGIPFNNLSTFERYQLAIAYQHNQILLMQLKVMVALSDLEITGLENT